MAVPGSATYSVAAKVAAHQAFANLIDAGAGAGLIKVRDSGDVLLGTIILDDPAGSVNGGTGQLTFTIATNDASADASGTIAYVEFTDSDGTVQLSLPAQQGGSAVSGYAVFNTLTVIAGAPLEIVSATIG